MGRRPRGRLRLRGGLALASRRVGTSRGVSTPSLGTCTRVEKVVEAVRDARCVEQADESAVEARVAPAVGAQTVCRAATLEGQAAQSKSNGWRRRQVDRARVLRVLREMKWWYERQDRVWQEVGSLEQASTAEQLKRLLVARCPDSEAGLEIREGLKHDRLWDRLQLVVARVRGRREHFVTAFSADGVWELLRLRVSPQSANGGGTGGTCQAAGHVPGR